MDSIVETFAEFYFGHLNLAFSAWRNLADDIRQFCADDEDAFSALEEELGKEIGERNSSKNFPVSRIHKRKVAFWLQDLSVRPLKRPFSDWRLIPEDEVEPDYIFKTYGSGIVLLEENRDPIGQGTTGLISWQGALALTAWAEALGTDVLKDRRVLELGSGLGLFGINAVKCCSVKSFVFTDCHDKVLEFLRLNVDLNFAEPKRKSELCEILRNPNAQSAKPKEECRIQRLDWTDFNEEDLPSDIDVVVASDVVYAVALVPGLCAVIAALLGKGATAAFVACTKRNGDTIDTFLAKLKSIGLNVNVEYRRKFSVEETIMTNHEPLRPITLYKITN